MGCLDSFYETICCVNKPKFPDPYHFQFSGRGETP